MSGELIDAARVTLLLAAMTSMISVLLSILLAFWLYKHRFQWWVKALLLISFLPIAIPATVIGFILLAGLSPDRLLGQWWISLFGEQAAFSFLGILLASLIISFPFALHPIYVGYLRLPQSMVDTAAMLRLSFFKELRWYAAAQTKPAIALAALLTFVHTLGEFGAILLVGGAVTGETKVLSVLLFEQIERFDLASATETSLVLLFFALIISPFIMRWSLPQATSKERQDDR